MRDAARFIVLEGGDGVGKTTQIALLSSWLDAVELPFVSTREPGGTPLGEAVREVVLDRPELDVPAESELFLILAARAVFVRDVVRPALAEGKIVVADRFTLSTLAYQGYGRGLDLDGIRQAIGLATGGLEPDLCVLLDVPLEESGARRRRGGAGADRIEREGEDFRRTVREAYLELAETEPGVQVVDGRGTPEEVHKRVRDCLVSRFPTTFPSAGATEVDRAG